MNYSNKNISLDRKGIILAGGNGTRLYPITKAVSKQLLPIYDKPTIYYPLSTLMSCGIREFLIICKEIDLNNFKRLLKDGNDFGIKIEYKVQKNPDGIASALILGESFIGNSDIALILGDNLFYGDDIDYQIEKANLNKDFSTIFALKINNPERYGVVEFD